MIQVTTIFIYHVRSIGIGILVIGGMISFGILYTILSFSETPQEGVPQIGENVSVADDHIAAVFSWIEGKEKTKAAVPIVSNSAFFIPTGL